MEGFDNLKNGYPQVIFSIILRAVINARKQNRIKPIWIVGDEFSRFVPDDKDPSCKELVMESFDVDTKYNVNYMIATQEVEKLPPELVRQCRYIMVPYNADPGVIRYCMMLGGCIRYQQTALNEALALKRRLKKHYWAVLDRNTGSITIIKFLAPLSHHMEQED